jgi:uncharacterized membrane protein
LPLALLDAAPWARAIQAVAALVLSGYVLSALVALVPDGDVRRARLVLTEGVLVVLGLMVPATVLRTLAVRSWDHILALAFVLGLRILLKKLFLWEKSRILA